MADLYILDVGHGNCTIVVSHKHCVVIDAPPGGVVMDALEHLNVRTITAIIVSHADNDHIAGITGLLVNTSLIVERVIVNPDAKKRTNAWQAFRIALRDAQSRDSVTISTNLNTDMSDAIEDDEVRVEVLFPTPVVGLAGPGGEDLQGRTLRSNSMSAVLRVHDTHGPVAVLAGDMDSVGLENILADGDDIKAPVLVFPHHGGAPGRKDPEAFAKALCDSVEPEVVIFSFDRKRFELPNPRIISGLLQATKPPRVACTQLSMHCAKAKPELESSYCSNIPAHGAARQQCCAGSLHIPMNCSRDLGMAFLARHAEFVDGHVETPLCRHNSTA